MRSLRKSAVTASRIFAAGLVCRSRPYRRPRRRWLASAGREVALPAGAPIMLASGGAGQTKSRSALLTYRRFEVGGVVGSGFVISGIVADLHKITEHPADCRSLASNRFCDFVSRTARQPHVAVATISVASPSTCDSLSAVNVATNLLAKPALGADAKLVPELVPDCATRAGTDGDGEAPYG